VFLASAALIALVALGAVIVYTIWRGWPALHHRNFFDQDMSRAGPLAPLTVGGVAHALVGTLWQIGIALVLAVPLGIVCAVYLDQTRSRFANFVRTIVNAMTAFPSILAGLFIYAFWILALGFQFSGLAAGLALSIMMLPYIIRTSDLVLRLVPAGLRESSEALGAPRWRTMWHVVLPTARSGLATGVILGTARGIGEASPVLLTAGFTTYMNANPLHEPMVSLPLEALELVRSGIPAYAARGYADAALLLVLILVLFVIARVIGGFGPGHLTRRQRRRAERVSGRIYTRITSSQGFTRNSSATEGFAPPARSTQ
jgi:phosphate transport system permease protein